MTRFGVVDDPNKIILPSFIDKIEKEAPTINKPLKPSEKLNVANFLDVALNIDISKLTTQRIDDAKKGYTLQELKKICSELQLSPKTNKSETHHS